MAQQDSQLQEHLNMEETRPHHSQKQLGYPTPATGKRLTCSQLLSIYVPS